MMLTACRPEAEAPTEDPISIDESGLEDDNSKPKKVKNNLPVTPVKPGNLFKNSDDSKSEAEEDEHTNNEKEEIKYDQDIAADNMTNRKKRRQMLEEIRNIANRQEKKENQHEKVKNK